MELWDIYNKKGLKTGIIKTSNEILLDGEYHLAVEVWILNSRLEILIQKRADTCSILPGIWAMTTGKVISGESSNEACIREIKEEISVDILAKDLNFIDRIFRDMDNMIWDIYLIKRDLDLKSLNLQQNEVSELKFVSVSEFKNMINQKLIFEYPEIYNILDKSLNIIKGLDSIKE